MEKIMRIAIIGAGVQGSMLAFRALAFGKTVCLYSRSVQTRENALRKIKKWLQEWTAAGRLKEQESAAALTRLSLHATLADTVREAQLVIENLPEILELKQAIWLELDKLSPEGALLCSNSSSLKSSDIGLLVKRKDKICNLNFMTPTKDDLVELMWPNTCVQGTKDAVLAYLKELGHVPVITQKEIQGFSLNRVWRAIKRESLHLWAEGYTTPEDLDRAWMLEWGTPYGPFGLMDKVGLDTVAQIEMCYYERSGRREDLPPKALEDLISRGCLGEKSGQGFYSHPDPAYMREDFLDGGKT